MLLIQIRDLLKEKQSMSILEIASIMKLDVNIVRQGLEYLIEQDQIEKTSFGKLCCDSGKGCGSCSLLALEVYSCKPSQKIVAKK